LNGLDRAFLKNGEEDLFSCFFKEDRMAMARGGKKMLLALSPLADRFRARASGSHFFAALTKKTA